jgi:hypothetical protein
MTKRRVLTGWKLGNERLFVVLALQGGEVHYAFTREFSMGFSIAPLASHVFCFPLMRGIRCDCCGHHA